MTVPGGLDKQVQFNNNGAFGGTTGFEYQAAADPRLSLTQPAGFTGLYIKDPTATTPPSFVLSSTALIQCSLTDGSTSWCIAYTNDQAPNNWGSFVNDAGGLQFTNVRTDDTILSRVIFDGFGSVNIESLIIPVGATAVGFNIDSADTTRAAFFGSQVESNHIASFGNLPSGAANTDFLSVPHSMAFRSVMGGAGTPGGLISVTDGPIIFVTPTAAFGSERMRIDTAGLVGINKASSIGAQTHIVSGAAARVGLIVDSAASPTADILQVRQNTSATAAFAVKPDGMYTYPGLTVLAADQSVVASTTFVTVTGFSVNVRAGRTYIVEVNLAATLDATGGGKFQFSGTATMTQSGFLYQIYNPATNAVVSVGGTIFANTINEGITSGITAIHMRIFGSFVVNAAGTFTFQFAQNSANGTSTVNANPTWMRIVEQQ